MFDAIGMFFANVAGMKKRKKITLAVFAASLCGTAFAAPTPESQLTGPVEESLSLENSRKPETSSLDRKRAERLEARERLLSKLRESSLREKSEVRKDVLGKREENSRNPAESRKSESLFRERDREGLWRKTPDDGWMPPGRGMPPPEFGEPKF